MKESSNHPFSLGAKLELFDANCKRAVQEIIVWLEEHPDDLIALARGRHVAGHYRYQEAGLFEYDSRALLAEAAEELADAIVYLARRQHLTNQ